MVLLVSAGLLLRSFARLTSVTPGFDAQHIVKADISLPQFQYSTPQQWSAFSEELLARIQSDPGLQDSAVVVPRPIADTRVNLPFDIVGNPPSSAGASRAASYVSVSPDYFRVMGIPLLAGRFESARQLIGAPRFDYQRSNGAALFPKSRSPRKADRVWLSPGSGGPCAKSSESSVMCQRRCLKSESRRHDVRNPYVQAPFWGANLVVKTL